MILKLLQLPSTWLLIAMIGIWVVGFKSRLSPMALLGLALYVFSYAWGNTFTLYDDHDLRHNLYRFYLAGMMAVYCGVVFACVMWPRLVRSMFDAGAQGIWVILFLGEAFQAYEFLFCRLLNDPGEYVPGQWMSQYACGRIYGWFAPFISPVVTGFATGWIVARAWKVRRHGGSPTPE